MNSEADIISWNNLEASWQEKIKRSLFSQNLPTQFISPHTQESLASVIADANLSRSNVMPCGSGSKLSWGGLAKDVKLVVSTQRLDRIIEHAVGDLTVTVEAGIKLADLQNTLKEVNQFLPLDPAYPESATIGGIVATADAGSWRHRYGGVRDLVLGLSFVRADGKIAKAGGRVVKNVAGYDLMKLFAGSYGTLGIISQVTFRLYPIPDDSITVVITGEDSAIATATKTLLASSLTPTAADLLSPLLVKKLDLGDGMGLLARFQSIPESVEEQGNAISSIAQQLGLKVRIDRHNDEAELWQKLQKIMTLPDSDAAVTSKIGILPSAAVNLLKKIDGLAIVHVGSGLGRLHLDGEDSLNRIKQIRSIVEENRGFLTILESPAGLKQQIEPWGYTGNALEIMRKIKKQFDPENILNADRFIDVIA